MNDIELWKDIPITANMYAVSNFGRVRNNNTRKVLKPACLRSGYLAVALQCGGKQKTFSVHRLVAEAFVSGRANGKNIVNHIDGDKNNNLASNLEWCSYHDNVQHAREVLGHYAGKKRIKVLCVNTGEVFDSIADAAAAKGANKGNIALALKQRRAGAGGFFWWYPDRKLPKYKLGGRYPILCVETGEIFDNTKEAMKKYGVFNIYEVLKGNRKTAGGYHWVRITPEYFNNNDNEVIM